MFEIKLLVGGLLLVHSLRVVVRSCTLPRGMAERAVCGACRYEYTGWSRCPECGCEVAEVGVLTPALALAQRGGLLAAAVALLFVVGLVAASAHTAASAWARANGYYQGWEQQILEPHAEPMGSAAHYGVEVLSHALSGPAGAISGTLSVVVAPGSINRNGFDGTSIPGQPRVDIDVRTRRATVHDAAGAVLGVHEEFDIDAAETLFATAGLDIQDEFTRVGLEHLVQLAAAALVLPYPTIRGWATSSPPAVGALSTLHSASRSSATLPVCFLGLRSNTAMMVLTIGSAAVMYALILTWVVRRRRRLRGR